EPKQRKHSTRHKHPGNAADNQNLPCSHDLLSTNSYRNAMPLFATVEISPLHSLTGARFAQDSSVRVMRGRARDQPGGMPYESPIVCRAACGCSAPLVLSCSLVRRIWPGVGAVSTL